MLYSLLLHLSDIWPIITDHGTVTSITLLHTLTTFLHLLCLLNIRIINWLSLLMSQIWLWLQQSSLWISLEGVRNIASTATCVWEAAIGSLSVGSLDRIEHWLGLCFVLLISIVSSICCLIGPTWLLGTTFLSSFTMVVVKLFTSSLPFGRRICSWITMYVVSLKKEEFLLLFWKVLARESSWFRSLERGVRGLVVESAARLLLEKGKSLLVWLGEHFSVRKLS